MVLKYKKKTWMNHFIIQKWKKPNYDSKFRIQEEIKILYAKNLLHGKKNQRQIIKGKHIFAIYIKKI